MLCLPLRYSVSVLLFFHVFEDFMNKEPFMAFLIIFHEVMKLTGFEA